MNDIDNLLGNYCGVKDVRDEIVKFAFCTKCRKLKKEDDLEKCLTCRRMETIEIKGVDSRQTGKCDCGRGHPINKYIFAGVNYGSSRGGALIFRCGQCLTNSDKICDDLMDQWRVTGIHYWTESDVKYVGAFKISGDDAEYEIIHIGSTFDNEKMMFTIKPIKTWSFDLWHHVGSEILPKNILIKVRERLDQSVWKW